MKKKSVYAVLLTAAMAAFLLSGCQGQKETAQSSSPQTSSAETTKEELTTKTGALAAEGAENVETKTADKITVSINYDIPDLQPWSSATTGRLSVMQTVYEYMAYYDSDSDNGLKGILMKDYVKADDYTSKITIYDNIYDSAGNHMTASDVVFSFNSWKESGKSVKCKLLDSCTAIDDYTVEIKLTNDTVGDVENMLCGLVPIVTEAGYKASGDGMVEHVISTAPYVVTEYVSGSHLTVKKNENYWQKDESLILPVSRANVNEITFKIVTEKSQVSVNLETGVVDMAAAMGGTEVGRFESDEAYHVYAMENSNFYYITFNCGAGQMFENNAALRQAICCAIDSQGIVTGALKGRGIVNKAFANPVCVDYDTRWDQEPYYEYDLNKARELLTQSGFETNQVIRIMLPATDTNQGAAQIIQSYLLQLGLKCDILIYEQALFQSYRTEPGEWDIMLDSKQSVDYVTSLASVFQTSGDTPAINFVQDDRLQDIVESVQTNAGHTKDAVNEYMEYLKEQCYIYAMFRENTYHVAKKGIPSIFANFKGYIVPGACTYASDF